MQICGQIMQKCSFMPGLETFCGALLLIGFTMGFMQKNSNDLWGGLGLHL
jgi:hypothetical protein